MKIWRMGICFLFGPPRYPMSPSPIQGGSKKFGMTLRHPGPSGSGRGVIQKAGEEKKITSKTGVRVVFGAKETFLLEAPTICRHQNDSFQVVHRSEISYTRFSTFTCWFRGILLITKDSPQQAGLVLHSGALHPLSGDDKGGRGRWEAVPSVTPGCPYPSTHTCRHLRQTLSGHTRVFCMKPN